LKDDLILNFHPETRVHNYEEIKQLAKVTRNKNGIIVDELHKTIPILTKYERTRILGQRAKQIESGGGTLVQVPPNVIDSYLIAKLELEQKKIPFIIRRPLPNGGMEYWYVSDLEHF
jgi:DNA-directed RNA polymerase I, II, and III subunit RPABC2